MTTLVAERLMDATERMAADGTLALTCPTCGRLQPLPGCLHLTESAVASLEVEGVIEVHRWLSGVLRRPPIVNGGEAWAPLRRLLEALQRDLALLPTVDDAADALPDHMRAGALPWSPHPAMSAAEQGIESTDWSSGHVERAVVDGWGIER